MPGLIMDVLLVGFSSFARRRVLPALAELDEISAVHVATRGGADADLAAVPKRGRVFRDPARAIHDVPRGLVYVSTANASHATWVEQALACGHHVVVDKPAVTELADAERLVARARREGRVLAEALTYAFHPALDALHAEFAAHGSRPTHATATFTPPVPPTDFRYRRSLGGGALLDAGPYAVSIGRLLWDDPPTEIHACIGERSADGEVDTSFSMLARYPGGRALVGHFGFTTEYTNTLQVLGPQLAVTVPRVFSAPPELVTSLTIRHRDRIVEREVPAASAMRRFLSAVLRAISTGDVMTFGERLLRDARALDLLRVAAQDPNARTQSAT